MKQLRNSKFEIRNWPRAIILIVLALALYVVTVPSHAQQPWKVYRIGYFGGSAPAPNDTTPQQCPIKGAPTWQAFVEGLREHGYLLGQNLVIECRYTQGREERAPALAAELVSLKVDLLVAVAANQVRTAKLATSTLPIVMVGGVTNPVGRGLIASVARPGGNVTGLTDAFGPEIMGKYLQLLKEAIPTVSRVGFLEYLTDPLNPSSGLRREVEVTARALGVTLLFFAVTDPKDFEIAFGAMTKARIGAFLPLGGPYFLAHVQRLVDLATQNRLPTVYAAREFVEAGGLMSYGANTPDIYRRLGYYVDRILKGANPGELPVEQPTKFELVINLKTAKALGLTIPQSLLMRADEVIE
jgi:putative ABC transport system substrate-binding protein